MLRTLCFVLVWNSYTFSICFTGTGVIFRLSGCNAAPRKNMRKINQLNIPRKAYVYLIRYTLTLWSVTYITLLRGLKIWTSKKGQQTVDGIDRQCTICWRAGAGAATTQAINKALNFFIRDLFTRCRGYQTNFFRSVMISVFKNHIYTNYLWSITFIFVESPQLCYGDTWQTCMMWFQEPTGHFCTIEISPNWEIDKRRFSKLKHKTTHEVLYHTVPFPSNQDTSPVSHQETNPLAVDNVGGHYLPYEQYPPRGPNGH